MVLRIFATDATLNGSSITASTNDTIIVTEGTELFSVNFNIFDGASGTYGVAFHIDGTIGSGYGTPIDMTGWVGSNTVTVGKTGRIIGDGVAIRADGYDAAVYNSGEIRSYNNPFPTIYFASERAYLFNEGSIFASQDAALPHRPARASAGRG